jgi:mono/diheme cytochrome c family protein
MPRKEWFLSAAVSLLLMTAASGPRSTLAQQHGHQHSASTPAAGPSGTDGHHHSHGSRGKTPPGTAGHVHADVPPEYKTAHLPSSAWTSPRLLERGKVIYQEKCAVCHGDAGDGRGPAAAALPVPPADLRDREMVAVMLGKYWFWRVSEGGLVEPYRSAGSTMPAWKDALSVEDRWAVIAYQHRFSGHGGPHVTSEHPEMVAAPGRPGGMDASAPGSDRK